MTPHPNDSDLLTAFLRRHDHAAFSELMQRYLPVVYSAALRVTEQPALAADISQDVFLRLAQSPPALMKGVPLVAWLHRTTRHRALDLIRSERSRERRERESVGSEKAEALPAEALAMLDEVIDGLPAADRSLVLRRFFGGESFAVISGAMGLSEDAVRMRVNRALEKMRGLFARRGVTTSAVLLASGMASHAALSSPPTQLQASILTLVQNVAPAGPGAIFSLILMKTSQKLIVGAALVAVAAVTVIVMNRTHPVAPAEARPTAATGVGDESSGTATVSTKPDRVESFPGVALRATPGFDP